MQKLSLYGLLFENCYKKIMCLISGFKENPKLIINRGYLPGLYKKDDWTFWCVRLPTRGEGYLPYVNEFCVGLNGEIFVKEWDVKYLYKKIKEYKEEFGLLKGIFYLSRKLDGEFSFFVYDDDLIIVRDFPGTKPLFFWEKGFCSLPIKGMSLPPGCLYSYKLNKIIQWWMPEPKNYNLEEILENAVKKRCFQKKVGILFSGGIDSSLVAYYASKYSRIVCVCIGFENSQDVKNAKRVANEFGWDLIIEEPFVNPKISYLSGNNLMDMEISTIIYQSCRILSQEGIMVALTGQGSDELFGGYRKYSYKPILKEFDLYDMYFRNLERDDRSAMWCNVEILFPFLDKKIINYALYVKDVGKKVLLNLCKKLKIPVNKKKAMQYGSGIHKRFLKYKLIR